MFLDLERWPGPVEEPIEVRFSPYDLRFMTPNEVMALVIVKANIRSLNGWTVTEQKTMDPVQYIYTLERV